MQQHAQINQDSPEAKDYCVERKVDTETVKKANGAYETQLLLTYSIYDTCYWEKACGIKYISFVAGSPEELHGFLNEVIGEPIY
ncbi:MAG: hypothetical protein M3Q07_28605 [Pseudobdellovibrionaceae bacterium]|nr:hypothetical protein [Pseudobdellovibrionaceae bacterium]